MGESLHSQRKKKAREDALTAPLRRSFDGESGHGHHAYATERRPMALGGSPVGMPTGAPPS